MALMSKITFLSTALVAGLFAAGASSQPVDPNPPRDQDRTRDRAIERGQQTDRDRAAGRDRTADRAQERVRDMLHVEDRDQVRDRDFYGYGLMTEQERAEHRARLQNASSDEEWARIRAEHQEQMQARARAQGIDLPPPMYGEFLMTARERERYQERIRQAPNEQARVALRSEHQQAMRARARELGLDLPEPLYGQGLMRAEEQQQFRDRLRAATTEEERAQLRAEHRTLMQERARQLRVPLDDDESDDD